jgi:hypothetical protein
LALLSCAREKQSKVIFKREREKFTDGKACVSSMFLLILPRCALDFNYANFLGVFSDHLAEMFQIFMPH